jgi:hypothetical protein
MQDSEVFAGRRPAVISVYANWAEASDVLGGSGPVRLNTTGQRMLDIVFTRFGYVSLKPEPDG